MDAFIPYFSDGAWFLLYQAHLTTLTLLILLFFVYSLADYRRALMLSVVFAAATLVGMILSACELFHLRSALTAFLLPFLATLLALFNILGAGAKHSAILEKTGYAIDILFGIVLGLSMGSGYGQADGTVFPLLCFTLGLAVGTILAALVMLCISSLVAFFGVNRRDYILVLSSIAIGLMIPLLIRTFPFTLR